MRFGAKSWLLILGGLTLSALIIVTFVRQFSTYNAGRSIMQPDVRPLQEGVKGQKVRDRIWKKVELNRILSLPKWGQEYVDEQENIYVFDYDLKINKFSSEGKFLAHYGMGKGSGPGEFLIPTDFAVDRESNIWICDGSTGLVTIFSRDGSLKKTLRIKSTPYRMCLLGAGKFIIQKSFPLDYLFEMYDSTGSLQREFGANILSEQSRFPILMGGCMATDGNFLYYAFHYFGYLACFNLKDGKVKYLVKTMDQLPMPKVQMGKEYMRISKDNQIASLQIGLEDGKILVKSGISLRKPEKGPYYTVIDTYLASDGSYLYSHKFSGGGFLHNKIFYQTTDTLLTKWKVTFINN